MNRIQNLQAVYDALYRMGSDMKRIQDLGDDGIFIEFRYQNIDCALIIPHQVFDQPDFNINQMLQDEFRYALESTQVVWDPSSSLSDINPSEYYNEVTDE